VRKLLIKWAKKGEGAATKGPLVRKEKARRGAAMGGGSKLHDRRMHTPPNPGKGRLLRRITEGRKRRGGREGGPTVVVKKNKTEYLEKRAKKRREEKKKGNSGTSSRGKKRTILYMQGKEGGEGITRPGTGKMDAEGSWGGEKACYRAERKGDRSLRAPCLGALGGKGGKTVMRVKAKLKRGQLGPSESD